MVRASGPAPDESIAELPAPIVKRRLLVLPAPVYWSVPPARTTLLAVALVGAPSALLELVLLMVGTESVPPLIVVTPV